jgi:uncharacterized protein with von Willebrand factor type A (vWA) domain
MNNESEISRKLREYDDAFDFYMDRGQMPETVPPDDLLGGFLKQTIDENPQLESQDPVWKELLKEEVMKFLEAMLELFQPIEKAYQREKEYMVVFADADIDQKRKMWREVYGTISKEYAPEEVNIDGYVEQMKSQDLDAVFASLLSDWDKACDELVRKKKVEIIEFNREKWEKGVKEHGNADFKERKKIEKMFFSYPQLVDIVRIIGREQPGRNDEYDETVRSYMPILPSPPTPAVEVEQVSLGKDLQHLLPMETAILADKETEDLFYLRYASSQLQLFANKPKQESVLKTEKKRNKKPRLEKGPIIVSLDTSGSMSGRPEKVARCLLLQLLRMAKKQKRKCFLITFSVRAECMDLSRPGSWNRLNRFLNNPFTGGTDGEDMIKNALKMLNTDNYSMADVLIISDFYFPNPRPQTKELMEIEHNKGTRFYGLQIESTVSGYDNVLDKIWKV